MGIQLLLIFDYDFLSDCPSLMHGITIRYVQHSQAMLKRGVHELAHSFFFQKYFCFLLSFQAIHMITVHAVSQYPNLTFH